MRIFYVLSIVISVSPLLSQSWTISGNITDESTGEDLIYANVTIDDQGMGTQSNAYGFYSLSLDEGTYKIIYSYLGYESVVKEITLSSDLSFDVHLSANSNELEEIVVTAKAEENANISSTEVSVVSLNVKKAAKIPVLLGEKDIVKTLQLLPGVASNSEGGSGFFVRGGDTDQNLVLLDEAPVYNASHLLGFFSVFNSDALKDVKLYKGGIPAQYGGRASSVMDIRMKDGNSKEWAASGGIGIISSRLTLEGPLVKERGSIIVSGRRTYADYVAKLFSDEFDDTQLYFYDFNVKANYKVNSKNRIYLSGYFGRDVLGLSEDLGLDWGNSTFTGRWNSTVTPKLFSNLSFIYSDYDYGFDVSGAGISANLSAGIYDYLLKQDFDYYLNANNKISFGWLANYHQFKPRDFKINAEDEEEYQLQNTLETAVYISNEQKIGDRLNLNYGIRANSFSNIGAWTEKKYDDTGTTLSSTTYTEGEFYNNYFGIEPRLNGSFVLDEKQSLKFSYNRNYQYLHQLSNSNSGAPTDIWIPSSTLVKPIISDQLALGYFRNFSDNSYKFNAEIYYKWLQNTVDYRDGADIFNNDDIEKELVFGKGRAYGLELLLEKTKGDFTGWISYTLSKVQNQSDLINNGEWYSARQDRTHDLSIVGVYELSPRWSISGSWVYYTGDAVTFPSGKYFIDDGLVNLYTSRNANRMPDYHRLDLGFTYVINKSDKFSSDLNVSLYNVYNRRNAYTITFDTNSEGQTQASRLALFGTVPSVTWNFNF